MTRRWLWAGLGLAVLAGAAAWLPPSARGEAGAVPTIRIVRAAFVHRVVAEGNLESVDSTPINVPSDSGPQKVAWLADDGARVEAGDVVARFDPTDAEKLLADGLADRRSAASKTERAAAEGRSRVRNLDRDAEQARLEVETARRHGGKDAEVFSRVEIIEDQIDEELAVKREEHARDVRRTRESLSRTELDLLAIEGRQAELRIAEAEGVIRALEARAPHEGLVLIERDRRGIPWRVGQTVFPGTTIARIPDLERMQADLHVLEADAGGLAVGELATVVVEAHPGIEYEGKVKHVDKVAKPRIRNTPIQYFGVKVELAATDPRVMKPGGRVRAVIDVERREGVLAVPRQAVFARDAAKVVHRKRPGGGFAAVPVTLGAASLTHVVVEDGLAEGDEVALCDPARCGGAVAEPRDAPPSRPGIGRP